MHKDIGFTRERFTFLGFGEVSRVSRYHGIMVTCKKKFVLFFIYIIIVFYLYNI